MAWATVGAACMIAHQVAGKAARDGFFLMAYSPSDLPKMMAAAALLSVGLAILSGKVLQRLRPRILIPFTFGISSLLHLAEWIALPIRPGVVAPLIYLHNVGLGAILLSGFWLLLSEAFDLREAKASFGRIAGAGTVGGIAGGLMAERIVTWASTEYLLMLLALLHFACGMIAWQIRPEERMAARTQETTSARAAFAATPLLWQLASLVFLGTCAAALLDYLFKLGATIEMGKGPALIRFFALYYTGAQVFTFLLQTFAAQPIASRFGLGASVGSLPVLVGTGSLAALLIPVFPLVAAVRAIEAILRGSLFRSSYEFLYAPVPPQHKRAVKTVIDVGFDRMGDAAGAGAVQVMVWLGPALARPEILGLTMVLSAVSTWLAMRLNAAYRRVIEQGLVERAREQEAYDDHSSLLNTMFEGLPVLQAAAQPTTSRPAAGQTRQLRDRILVRMAELRSADAERARSILEDDEPWDPLLVPQAIRLLAWDAVSASARAYLERCGARITGQLNDSLADQDLDFGIRRRIPRLLARVPSQLSADGLVQGLADKRFEIRYQCGRALDYMKRHHAGIHFSAETLMDVIRRELSVSSQIWRSRRVLESGDSTETDRLLEDAGGADHNLEHVFSLLAVILPREPLTAAYHGIHQSDKSFRALAFEYLENTLPQDVRQRLWALIEETPVTTGAEIKHVEAELLRVNATLKFARDASASETHAAVLAAKDRSEAQPHDR